MKRGIFSFGALFIAVAAQATPSAIYTFGDSLVDAGNVHRATLGLIPPAGQGYFSGRFTNGPTYVDILHQRLFGSLSTPFLDAGNNFAVGGARAVGDADFGIGIVPGLPNQLNLYTQVTGGFVDPDALYILNFGNNDVNAIQAGDTYNLSAFDYGQLFASNIVGALDHLGKQGATNFLVVGVPNPLESEGVILQAQLDAALDAFLPTFSGSVLRYDIMNFFTRVALNPTAYGLAANLDVTGSCIDNRPVVHGTVNCTGFLLFDGTHPIKEVHRLLADEISLQLGLPVPEPESWTMLIAGFGIIGLRLRRRRARARA